MNGANHRIDSVTTYPFNIMGNGWEKATPSLEDLPIKGDTVVGNDVWIGQNVTIMPGIHIGDGVIVAANSVVTKDVPSYHIVAGNWSKIIKKRFKNECIGYKPQIVLMDINLPQKFAFVRLLFKMYKVKEFNKVFLYPAIVPH